MRARRELKFQVEIQSIPAIILMNLLDFFIEGFVLMLHILQFGEQL